METKVKEKAKIAKKPVAEKAPKSNPLGVAVFDVKGERVGEVTLAKEIFGRSRNDQLLAQAVRVYLANQRGKGGKTKTRSEVAGGGAKPWRQKGTGRARAGSIRSPLWRGGGIIHGPMSRDFGLSLPKKMKKAALAVALSLKATSQEVVVLNKLELAEPKTKLAAKVLEKLPTKGKALFVIDAEKNLKKAFQNITQATLTDFKDLNAYEVLAADNLIFTKGSLEALEKFFTKNVD